MKGFAYGERVPGSTTRVVQFSDWVDSGDALYDEAVRRGYHWAKAAVFTKVLWIRAGYLTI